MVVSGTLQRFMSQYIQEYACVLRFNFERGIRITSDDLSGETPVRLVGPRAPSSIFSSVDTLQLGLSSRSAHQVGFLITHYTNELYLLCHDVLVICCISVSERCACDPNWGSTLLQSWELLTTTHQPWLSSTYDRTPHVHPPQFARKLSPAPSFMAPYNFDAPDADVVLCSSDGKEFRAHRLILSLTSPVFQGMFSLHQSTEPSSQIPSVDVSESSDVLQPFIQYLYPRPPPKVSDTSMWAALYTIADKYGADVVMDLLRDMLIPHFLDASPLRVYALASRWGFEEEAKIASKITLTMDIFKELLPEDAELMGGGACRQLYLLHFNRREAAQALISDNLLPSPSDSSCKCPPPDYTQLIPTLRQRVAKRPLLTVEDIYRDVVMWDYPNKCSAGRCCRNSITNMHASFLLLVQEVSRLPQTI